MHRPGSGLADGTRVIPTDRKPHPLVITHWEDEKTIVLNLKGDATARNINVAVNRFRASVSAEKPIGINFADTRLIDARFIGLLVMLGKQLAKRRLQLTFTGVPPRIERLFRLNGFEFLLRRVPESVSHHAREDR